MIRILAPAQVPAWCVLPPIATRSLRVSWTDSTHPDAVHAALFNVRDDGAVAFLDLTTYRRGKRPKVAAEGSLNYLPAEVLSAAAEGANGRAHQPRTTRTKTANGSTRSAG